MNLEVKLYPEESNTQEYIYPAFYEILSPSDQEGYQKLRASLSSSQNKYKRNKRLSSLQYALNEIQKFCIRGDQDDWRRSLVCGVCWLGLDIAINTRQLRLMIDKCKSSINGALSKMGYGTMVVKGEGSAPLLSAIPQLRGNFLEQRMWTIRKRIISSPAPNVYMNYAQFSPAALYVTPQPNRFENMKPTKINEIQTIFGVTDLEKTPQPSSDSEERPPKIEEKAKPDFYQDPCCCCPIDWANIEQDDEDFLIYG